MFSNNNTLNTFSLKLNILSFLITVNKRNFENIPEL